LKIDAKTTVKALCFGVPFV